MKSQPLDSQMAQHLPPVDKQKLQLILEIKDAYHQGTLTLEQARKRMLEEVGTVKPYEFALAEQELKTIEDDECRKEDIQAMLDLFQDVMDTSRPDLHPDHPIMCYYRENDMLKQHLSNVEQLAQKPVIPNQWYELYDLLAQHRTHLARKQNQLYPVLERKGFDRPTTTMWLLDDFVRDEVRDARILLEKGDHKAFIEMQPSIVADLLDLMQKEETVLYPTSLAMITNDEFEDMRLGDHEIGFAWISVQKPEVTNSPKASTQLMDDLAALLQKHGLTASSPDATLDVTTGKLTLEQINLIYQHLPIDISYVDEQELVRFYSDTDHRIFPRSKNVIGRDVKNCHPRTSVHLVEEIIRKFRSGEQNTVDFWINKPGLFIYIHYVAVRDAQGRFRGVLEMMQDCTRIRSLEGSQTLLTWSQNDTPPPPAPENASETDAETECDTITDITPETRLKDLLKAYPSLKEELPKINPAFRMLQTPLARVMVPKATVAMMSERSGEPIDSLIAKLKETIARL